LTIKNSTHPVAFDITVNGNTATTAFKVDRTKYDIKYGSGSFNKIKQFLMILN
jgi:polyisoprenoid-binding protein YceI